MRAVRPGAIMRSSRPRTLAARARATASRLAPTRLPAACLDSQALGDLGPGRKGCGIHRWHDGGERGHTAARGHARTPVLSVRLFDGSAFKRLGLCARTRAWRMATALMQAMAGQTAIAGAAMRSSRPCPSRRRGDTAGRRAANTGPSAQGRAWRHATCPARPARPPPSPP